MQLRLVTVEGVAGAARLGEVLRTAETMESVPDHIAELLCACKICVLDPGGVAVLVASH